MFILLPSDIYKNLHMLMDFVLIVKFCQGHSELLMTKKVKGVDGEVLARAKLVH